MDKETIINKFDMGLKCRLTGNILTFICLLLRLFVFPHTIPPLLTLFPLGAGLVLSIIISFTLIPEDSELSADDYKELYNDFRKQHSKTEYFLRSSLYFYIVIGFIMTYYGD